MGSFEGECALSGLAIHEGLDLSRGSGVGERSEDLGVNVRVSNVVFDLEVGSGNDLRSEVHGEEGLESLTAVSFDSSLEFDHLSDFIGIGDFNIGGTTTHHF